MSDWSYYRLLIIISFLSFVFNRRKIDIGILIFWIFFLLFSLAAIRNMVFFSFAAYLAIVANSTTIRFKDVVPMRFTEKKFLFLTSAVAQALIVVWALKFYTDVEHNGYFDFDKYERKSEFGGVSQKQFPIKATNFLMKNKVRGNFYNDFNSGAYLVGHCFPKIKVFIDGRTEVYGPAFFKYYQDIQEKDDVEKFKAAVKRFQITGAFLNTVFNPAPEKILNYLYNSPDWALVYFDYDGLVFLKNAPINRDVISRNRIDLATWKAKALDLYRLGSKDVVPYQNLNRAYTLQDLNMDTAAAAEAQAALAVNPAYAGPYKILGKIASKKKDYESAYTNFRIASSLSFNDHLARMNMALALTDLKRFNEAAEQYQKIIDIWPSSSKPHFKYAKVEIINKKYAFAFELLQKGYSLDAAASSEVLTLGDMFADQKAYPFADKTYGLVIAKNPQVEEAYLKLCQVYERTGDRDKAVNLLKKGVAENSGKQRS
jgi:tetratricopeptide (TPR) repeat protein